MGNTYSTQTSKHQAGSRPSQLVTFCSQKENNISVVNIDTMKSYANFQGTFLGNSARNSEFFWSESKLIMIDYPWTYVREIPNTQFVCSLQHDDNTGSKLKIFDISCRKINEVFSTEVIQGSNQLSCERY